MYVLYVNTESSAFSVKRLKLQRFMYEFFMLLVCINRPTIRRTYCTNSSGERCSNHLHFNTTCTTPHLYTCTTTNLINLPGQRDRQALHSSFLSVSRFGRCRNFSSRTLTAKRRFPSDIYR